jgi:pantoate--beta-alanine ligase
MGLPLVLRTKADLDAWRTNTSGSIGFVPTMGSLHSGHVFLASTAREQNENTVVSIFVNPKQFAKGEDLESYPRTLDADVRKLKGVADVVFAPTNDTMYPTDFGTHITAGSLGKELCGQYRPPHFDGVVTVVYLLLRLVRPDNLYLGQKDYQQVVIVRRMVKDLMLNAKVVGVETQRDVRGLALSSRNQYLDEQQITEAAHIRKCLLELRESALTPGCKCSRKAAFCKPRKLAQPQAPVC